MVKEKKILSFFSRIDNNSKSIHFVRSLGCDILLFSFIVGVYWTKVENGVCICPSKKIKGLFKRIPIFFEFNKIFDKDKDSKVNNLLFLSPKEFIRQSKRIDAGFVVIYSDEGLGLLLKNILQSLPKVLIIVDSKMEGEVCIICLESEIKHVINRITTKDKENHYSKETKNFYPTWQEAGRAAVKLEIKSYSQYRKKYKQDNKLPSNPNIYYKDFPGWIIFLEKKSKNFYSTWQEASRATMRLGIKSVRQYRKKYKQDNRLPSNPDIYYKDFPSWVIFFGRNHTDGKLTRQL